MLLTRGLVAALGAAALIYAQGSSTKQLTARELFYAATQPPGKAAEPPKAPAKTETPKAPAKAVSNNPRLHKAPSKPVEMASADPAPNQDFSKLVVPAVLKTAPMPANGQPPLGLRLNVMRYNPDGSTTDVLPDTVFRSGDRIRLSVEPNARGFLYIVSQGASGTWKAMFPSPEIEDGDNRAEAMHRYVIPPGKHVFTFDATAGKEVLFVVFSRQPVADFEELIYSLKGGNPQVRSDRTLIVAAGIGDTTISRMRAANARDLIIETVTPATAGAKQETAVYVVNPSGSSDSRVVADIQLVHQ